MTVEEAQSAIKEWEWEDHCLEVAETLAAEVRRLHEREAIFEGYTLNAIHDCEKAEAQIAEAVRECANLVDGYMDKSTAWAIRASFPGYFKEDT